MFRAHLNLVSLKLKLEIRLDVSSLEKHHNLDIIRKLRGFEFSDFMKKGLTHYNT